MGNITAPGFVDKEQIKEMLNMENDYQFYKQWNLDISYLMNKWKMSEEDIKRMIYVRHDD